MTVLQTATSTCFFIFTELPVSPSTSASAYQGDLFLLSLMETEKFAAMGFQMAYIITR